MRVYAAIDAGSNAIRMLVASIDENGGFHRLRYERTSTRLAQGISRTGNLSPENMARTMEALKRYKRLLASYRVSAVRAVGTSALREAANGAEFMGRVYKETGIRIEAIPHQEEARLSARGVTGFLSPARFFILDIGGGSTEWMLAEGQDLKGSGSIPTGVVKLAGVLKRHGKGALAKETGQAALKLKEAVWPLPAGTSFVVTGGTAATAASVDLGLARYEHDKVHGHKISLERLREIDRLLASLPLEKRRRLPGLEPDRADLIIPGAGLMIRIMEEFGLDLVIASDTGLPEGLILDLSERTGTHGTDGSL